MWVGVVRRVGVGVGGEGWEGGTYHDMEIVSDKEHGITWSVVSCRQELE